MDEMIAARIKSDYEYVRSLGHIVLGVFLQGSQNYNLAYEGSDIDTKCIVLPSFEDFCLNKKPTSTTLILPSNEHIDLKDIRLMFECFKKQNVNFVEILFTKYRFLNPDYSVFYQPMLDNAEAIAGYNNYAFVNCLAGMALEKQKALEHPYPTLIDKIEKFGYDPKQLHHIIRVHEFLARYIKGESYADCLVSKQAEYLINVKRGFHSLEDARNIAREMTRATVDMKNEYMNSHPLVVNHRVDELMNEVLVNVLRASFMGEMGIYYLYPTRRAE